jgi:hypothetical protein
MGRKLGEGEGGTENLGNGKEEESKIMKERGCCGCGCVYCINEDRKE